MFKGSNPDAADSGREKIVHKNEIENILGLKYV
jgi:hypothetical protein